MPAHDADDLPFVVFGEKVFDGVAHRVVVQVARERFLDVFADHAAFKEMPVDLAVVGIFNT